MASKEINVIEEAMRGGYETLPHYCQEWRVSKGISQVEIAARSGVSKSCVSRFESGSVKSTTALSGYLALGMPLPHDLALNYFQGKEEGK